MQSIALYFFTYILAGLFPIVSYYLCENVGPILDIINQFIF